MQYASGTPGVAQILEWHEALAQRVRLRPVAGSRCRMERLARLRSDAARARGHAGKPEIAKVDDGRAFPHAADDPRAIHAPEKAVEILILRGIGEHDRVFDGDGHAVVH